MKIAKIDFAGKEREFSMNLGALDEWEIETGRNALTENIFQGIKAGQLSFLLYVVLKQCNKEITLDFCKENLDPFNMGQVVIALANEYKGEMPKGDGNKKKA